MKSKLKIAVYSGEIPSTTFIENLIKGLGQTGITVYVFGIKRKHISYSCLNIHIFATPSHPFYKGLITLWRSFLLLLVHPKRFFILMGQLSNYDSYYGKWQWWSRVLPVLLHFPDIFHIQWAKDLNQWMFLKERFNCKLVLSFLGSHINYSPIADTSLALTYKQNFPMVDAFHAVSEAIGKEAEQYGASPAKTVCIRTILDDTLFRNFIPKKDLDVPLKIVSIGRHHWVKGYEYALAAMVLLKERQIPFHYDIIAQGDVSEKLLFMNRHLGLDDFISFKEGMKQADLFLALKNYDILLLPSVSEGIANVVLEAMAIGLPVVSTNCGGMAEVVIPNKTGWLVPVRDPEALASAIQEVAETPEKEIQRITLQAHEFVSQHFNAESSITQFLELYSRVMD
ncbi:glycosyltransferase family 4 protein [Aestuariivivens sediminicola]|uniref:glycosyltransferase family 4 protein n=1 Tax=Aestuariivivens sediminicola TaxID=2913560 RepID=UPI001F5ADC99|nr:glycosyltransferase family 4 protein [Aestuariivivens sediminicola]